MFPTTSKEFFKAFFNIIDIFNQAVASGEDPVAAAANSNVYVL